MGRRIGRERNTNTCEQNFFIPIPLVLGVLSYTANVQRKSAKLVNGLCC
jgi:hypothetical protein